HQMITNGAPEKRTEWPEELRGFHNRPGQLTTIDNVVLVSGRAIIPASLRQRALDILHSGHCGATGMADRAREVMFWPGMAQDTIDRRANCTTCIKTAPSQPAAPPTPLPTPRYPFQSVCSDYFQLAGNHYVVFVCRYSNWIR
ncbi:MAG: integrase zinc binding domain-containing protein, partial [SAR324 cluster bacterium]|nr:integrase zinc binding domain-containing protein [SAR324 cluster bacterium]